MAREPERYYSIIYLGPGHRPRLIHYLRYTCRFSHAIQGLYYIKSICLGLNLLFVEPLGVSIHDTLILHTL